MALRDSSSMLLEMAAFRAIEQIESELGLSRPDLARALRTSPRTVERWRSGDSYPQREARRRLAQLLALHHRLRETFSTTEAVHRWLHTENRYLSGLTPAEVIRAGRFDRVDAAIEALDSGIFL